MANDISNGFKLVRDVKSLDEAFYIMQDIRMSVPGIALLDAARILAEEACSIYDNAKLEGVPLGKTALQVAYDGIQNELKESKSNGTPSRYNMGFGAALGITSDKTVIGIRFGGTPAMCASMMGHPDFEQYPYWEDYKPDGVTQKEWAKRRGHWNSVLKDGIPAEEMFNIVFYPEYTFPLPEKEMVQSAITSFQKRLQVATEKSTMATVAAELNLRTQREILRYRLDNSDYQDRFDARKLVLSKSLKKDLTVEDLLERI